MIKKPRIYVDVHALQPVPPSCVNRDDTGSPKTAYYGGTLRSRISSQAWKRAIRMAFNDVYDPETGGIRTRKVIKLLKEEISALAPGLSPEEVEEKAWMAYSLAVEGKSVKKKKDSKTKKEDATPKVTEDTSVLLFTNRKQVKDLAKLAVDGVEEAKQYAAALAENPGADMILFGRMVATDPSLNYDAACQVGHAISTHEIVPEFDYFTAVDDLCGDESAGAGHIGVNEFNSSVLYRYATINVDELASHATLDAPAAVAAFLKAFINSMPTGKLNSFANNTKPSSVYITIRTDQPVSLAGAFEKPVQANGEGFLIPSQKALVAQEQKMVNSFIDKPYKAYVIGEGLDALAEPQHLNTVLEAVEKDLNTLLQGE